MFITKYYLLCAFLVNYGSSDVEKLKKLVLHNPVILTLSEVGHSTDDIIPKNVQQFWVRINILSNKLLENDGSCVLVQIWLTL